MNGPAALISVFTVVALVAWAIRSRKKGEENWRALADKYDGLTHRSGGDPSISGQLDGIAVDISIRRIPGRERDEVYTQYTIDLPDAVPPGLFMCDETFLRSFKKAIEGNDLHVGYPAIDEAFIIRADYEDRVHAFFGQPGVADAFRDLADSLKDVHLEDGRLSIDQPGWERSFHELERRLKALTRFRRRLEACLDDDGGESASVVEWQ